MRGYLATGEEAITFAKVWEMMLYLVKALSAAMERVRAIVDC